MCVCVWMCVSQAGKGGQRSKHGPQGASRFSLSNGFKFSFNEYRVKLNGKSIMAVKAEASTRAGTF